MVPGSCTLSYKHCFPCMLCIGQCCYAWIFVCVATEIIVLGCVIDQLVLPQCRIQNLLICCNVCPHLLHLTVLHRHRSIWQASHTWAPSTHTHTHTHAYIKISGASLTISDSVFSRWVSDFPSSAEVCCKNRKVLYGGTFLMAPTRHRNRDSFILLTMCVCVSLNFSGKHCAGHSGVRPTIRRMS